MAFGVTEPQRSDALAALLEMDDSELSRFTEDRMGQASEGHLVDYAQQCAKLSTQKMQDRLDLDQKLWQAHESEMKENERKDSWQSKMTTNEPFQTVMQAKALVRRAVVDKPNWFTVTTEQDTPLAKLKKAFWQDSLQFWTKRGTAQLSYVDMIEMSLAIGLSLALKPIWTRDRFGREGFELELVEPWKIHRDPDAKPRKGQSGLYCIHEDYVDYHVLVEKEKEGLYQDVRGCLSDGGSGGLYGLSREQEQRRKGLRPQVDTIRKDCHVLEVWGDVLDEHGELLLSNVQYTVAENRVIRPPAPVEFPTLRWPILQFAALPHLLNFHGYSLIEGMLKIWKFRNNILNLTADQLSYVLNAGYEVDSGKLINPADTELYPGCFKLKKSGAQGEVYKKIDTNKDFLALIEPLWSLTGNTFQNGVFVTELLKGEIGNRREITKGEVQIKTEQALGVFECIGKDCEQGGVELLQMMQEILTTYWDPTDTPNYRQVLGEKHQTMLSILEGLSPEQRVELMRLETDVTVQGISVVFQKSALVDSLINLSKLSDADRYKGMTKDYELFSKIADALDVNEVVKTQDELRQEQAMQTAQQAAQAIAQRHGMQHAVPDGAQPPMMRPDEQPHRGAAMADAAMQAAGIPV